MSTNKSSHPLRRFVRAGLALVILLLIIFAGSNIFLSSKPGQKFLQKHLSRRTHGITWQVAGATWSPWNGITVKELTAQLASNQESKNSNPPLLQLKKTKLKPYWGQLLRGKKLFRELILDEPHLNIPAEMFIAIEPTRPTPPPKPKVKHPHTVKPQPSQKPPKTKPPKKPKSKPTPSPQPTAKEKPKSEPKPIDEKRFWIRLRNAKVRVYSMKLGQDIEFHALNADLPLGGPPAKGSLSWKKITLDQHLLSGSQNLPIEWKSPTWTLPNQDIPLTFPQFADQSLASIPLQARVGGTFSPKRSSLDFRYNLSLSPQALPDYILHKSSRFHLRAQTIAANLTGSGSLVNASTWRFDSAFAMNDIEIFSQLRNQHLFFETAQAQVNLRNATLIAPNLSLRSEQLSLLGNGQIHLGGYLLGVLRIISDPELAHRFTRVANGSRISQGWTNHWLKPLETPDRYYRDLHVEGFLTDAQVNSGRKGEFIPLTEIINLLKAFTNRETAEELLPTSQPPSNNP